MVEITFSQSIGSVLTLEKRAQLKQIHEDLYSKKEKVQIFLAG
ncbi:Glucose-6-phosphate isomerase [Planococcus halocryophilus Or1]|nr:hypothetical protein [Planococcus halocryophilus]EMF47749.1 Glucose-6-phosphate isomerase [Planococcus halocryophilus Or1]